MSVENLAYATIRSSRENLAKGVARGQILEENVTVSTESHYDINTYYTKIKNGRLISPDTGLPLILSFRNVTQLDRTEINFFNNYELWAVAPNTTGTAIWVSPPHPYHEGADTKVIAFKKIVLDEEPAILNRSVNLKLADNDFMKLGLDMIQHSTEPGRIIFDPEVLRGELIVIEDDRRWTDVIQNYTDNRQVVEKIRSDDDIIERTGKLARADIYISMIEVGYSDRQIVERMQADGFINSDGGYTCPASLTVSSYMAQNSILYIAKSGEKKFVKNCGSCGAVINKEISAGYKCKVCDGVYEGC